MSKKNSRNLPTSRSPDKLHRLISSLPGMACQVWLDAGGALHFPYVSEGCLALLGIAPPEIELQPHSLLGMLHPEDRDAFYSSMRESAAQSNGFDETARNKPRSFGLRGIQERIKHLGGDVKITSEPGRGTQIAVCVPFDNTRCTFNSASTF